LNVIEQHYLIQIWKPEIVGDAAQNENEGETRFNSVAMKLGNIR
jgi:hypothetical protein